MRKKRAHNFIDMTGFVFGRLTVLRESKIQRKGKPFWVCKCECGARVSVRSGCLQKGSTKSCGCLCVDRSREANRKHGMKGSRIYGIWNGMKTRCLNESDHSFERYGGDGVIICDRWLDFSLFYEDMGDPPSPLHTINRIDNSKGYEKSNCNWATKREQASNRKSSVFVVLNGERVCCSEADRRLGFARGTVAKRIRKGITDFTAPVNKNLARHFR